MPDHASNTFVEVVPAEERDGLLRKLPEIWRKAKRKDLDALDLDRSELETIIKRRLADIGEKSNFAPHVDRTELVLRKYITLRGKTPKENPIKHKHQKDSCKTVCKAIFALEAAINESDEYTQDRIWRFIEKSRLGTHDSKTWTRPERRVTDDLLKLFHEARSYAESRAQRDPTGKTDHWALRCLVHELAEIFWKCTGLKVTASMNSWINATSPPLQHRSQAFIETMLKIVGIKIPAKSLYDTLTLVSIWRDAEAKMAEHKRDLEDEESDVDE